MCLWKNQYSVFELIDSPNNLVKQLSSYARTLRFRSLSGCHDYIQWLESEIPRLHLNRFVNALLETSVYRPRVMPLVGQILLGIEIRGLLPDRHLQQEFAERMKNLIHRQPVIRTAVLMNHRASCESPHSGAGILVWFLGTWNLLGFA